MALPAVDQFNEAVQNPQTAFTDPVLKSAQPKTNAYGIPQALGGSFALTYTFTSAAGHKWAVRCFHKAVAGLGERYAQISQTLNRLNNRYFVKFEYQPEGIRVNSVACPIVKMEWVDGKTLGSYLDRNYRDRASLLTLRNQFRQLEGFLRNQNIAHGDLQNGNVMVGCDVRLIDYDGLYVPDLPTGCGTELGHRHFQHPCRQASDHGPALDRFSFIAIDLALSAVAEKPELFKQFSTGENILFTANDYLDPDQSKVFQALRAVPALKSAVDRFAQVCAGPVAAVPALDAFLNPPAAAVAVTPRPAARPHGPAVYIGAFEVLDGVNFARGLEFVGQRVELIGKITNVKYGKTKTQPPKQYVFINFGHWLGKILKITIWSEGLDNLPDEARPTPEWIGRWISVTGLLDPPYSSAKYGYTHLSVTVTESSQMRLIAEQEEARWRLASIGQPRPVLPPLPPAPSPPPAPPQPKPQTGQPAPPIPATTLSKRRAPLAEIDRILAQRSASTTTPSRQSAPAPVQSAPKPEPPRLTPPLSPHPVPPPTVQPAPITPAPSPTPQPSINRPYQPQTTGNPPHSGVPAWVICVAIGVFLVWLFNARQCMGQSQQASQPQQPVVTHGYQPAPPAPTTNFRETPQTTVPGVSSPPQKSRANRDTVVTHGYQPAPPAPTTNFRETPQTTVPGVSSPPQKSRANRDTGKSASPKRSTKPHFKKRQSSPKSPPSESGQRWIPVM